MTVRLYYFPTPNGKKVSIALEEMGLDYEIKLINILKGEQSGEEFLSVCPNGRIPAMVDCLESGEEIPLFESGAMLQYLGRKTRRFYPESERQRTRVDAWLFWQMAHLGPMTGQVTFFKRAAKKPGRDPAETSYAIHRFEKEMRRLYNVLEKQLAGGDYVGGEYSIADMAVWPWVNQHHDYLGDLQNFPAIYAWHERIHARPAVQKAMKVGMDRIDFGGTAS